MLGEAVVLEALSVLLIGDLDMMGDPIFDEFLKLCADGFIVITIVIQAIEFMDLIFIAKVLRGVLDRIFIVELFKKILFGRKVKIDVCEELTQRFLGIAMFIMIIIYCIEKLLVLFVDKVNADTVAFIPVYEVHDSNYCSIKYKIQGNRV